MSIIIWLSCECIGAHIMSKPLQYILQEEIVENFKHKC